MSQTTLNLVAVTIFAFVMVSLLGPLFHWSPFIPAIAVFGMLGVATLDTFSWQGRAGTLLVDWVAGFSSAHRERVLRHEAGHFLAAHLLNIPVTGYTLSAWEAFRQGQLGQGGVSFSSAALEAELETELRQGAARQLIDRFCTVWMAGAAAEQLAYGNVEGGGDDRQKLHLLWAQLQLPANEATLKERWATLQAKSLLEKQQAAYEALVIAMTQRSSVADCQQVIEQHLSDPG